VFTLIKPDRCFTNSTGSSCFMSDVNLRHQLNLTSVLPSNQVHYVRVRMGTLDRPCAYVLGYLAHKQHVTEEAGPRLHKTILISVRQPTVCCILHFLCHVWYESSKDMWMIFISIEDVFCSIGYSTVLCYLRFTACSSCCESDILLLQLHVPST
jgi:hypothetical protein